ncbi:polynucleotide adenylyltransferase PcnB [Geomonas sp. RF6]|uniref:polynucleotide adenylyltransferase PcnB n=1 Tax=Geomonas sp. RF6 TaxID=2897342 RepID=UPI001E31110C|nr:polynucleotide adenylyltransferase PcnB [Geomonas sp. RF6]UFS72043.1 polynucleotide adenylyltransferase PcnB [Geomonas sp. RF6]
MSTIMNKNTTIIPRPQHCISRSLLSPNGLKVLYKLKENGYTAYLVGGGVRDLLLGREPKDFDIATNATPGELKKLFRNCRLIGRRFRLAHLHFQDEIIEVATFRSAAEPAPEEEPEPQHEPEHVEREGRRHHHHGPRMLKSDEGVVLRDNVFGTPEEDAFRRDFTVNALFYNIADFSIIDHVGGMEDLKAGVIRTIGDPATRFTEDPVRMIRAVRFAAMLGFTIEEETRKAIVEMAPAINRATPPRLFEEVLKLLLLGAGESTYQLLRHIGLFEPLFPHFDAWLTRESEGFPHARVGKALEWIDARIDEGEVVSPALLIALMFGEYLEERNQYFRDEGAPPQQATEMAVAQFAGELATTVLIPNRVLVAVREILGSQYRFQKTPGRNAPGFVGRRVFPDALRYLGFMEELNPPKRSLHEYWKSYASGVIMKAPHDAEEGAAPQKKKRRRRRRRKPTRMPEGP